MISENEASEDATPVAAEMSADAVAKLAVKPAVAAVAAALKKAGERTGVSFDLLYRMARRESALDPTAKASTSSAAGLFQFIEQTWLGAVKAHGARHGLADAAAAIERTGEGRYRVADPQKRAEILNLRFNPEHAAALAGELVRENRAVLEARLGREVSGAELYAAHFFGAAGAAKIIAAPTDAAAAAILPAAAAANRAVFYDGARARSVGEVLASIAKSIGGDGAGAPARAPETKSVEESLFARSGAGGLTARAPLALAPFEPQSGAVATTARAAPATARPGAPASSSDDDRARDLTRLFSLREGPAAAALLSPLAIAVLQALDPTSIRDGRDSS